MGSSTSGCSFSPRSLLRATGVAPQARWRDHAMLGQYKKHAEWRDGVYENTYAKDGGVWKIKSLHLYVNFVAPYEKGRARLKPGRGWCRAQRRRRSRRIAGRP